MSNNNENLLEGKWNQLKGQFKQKWGEFTDDELDQLEGNREELIGIIQEKYDLSEEEAAKEVDHFVSASIEKELS